MTNRCARPFVLALLLSGSALADIVITNSASWKPFSYLDESGEPRGLLVDYWRLYGEKTNTDITFRLVDWQSSLDLMASGEANIHSGLLYLPSLSETIDYRQGITHLDAQLYIHQDYLGQPIDEYLTNGEVAMVAGGAEEYYFYQNYPQVSKRTYPSNEAMMQDVLAGKLEAFIADMQVANHYFYSNESFNRYFPVRHLYRSDIRYGISKAAPVAIDTSVISKEELSRLVGRWFFSETKTVYPAYLIPLLIAALLITAAIYIFQLRRTVSRQTLELRVANELLQEQAHFDPLTSAMNRRAFLPAANKLISHHQPSQLILFDIDHFKRVNDSFGHASGDRVLTELSLNIKSMLPSHAVFARLGGEEFAIVLPLETHEHYWPSKVARAAESISFREDDQPVSVTVSSGVITIDQPAEIGELLKKADQLLYQAKNAGRNRWKLDKHP